MSLYNGPPRPGARGGRGEFSWDNVKADKDREYYLGHSVKASVGRWQKGKDIFWYNRDKGDMGVSRDEIEAVKAAERQAMAEALGLKVKAPAPNKLRQQPSLEKHEVDKLLRGASGDQQAATAAAEGDRNAGLGFRSGAGVAVREAVHEVLQGTGFPGSSAAVTAAGGAGSAGPGGPALMSTEQLAALDKMDTAAAAAAAAGKAGKKNKKDKKDRKEKKKRKKEHKDKKRKSTEKSRRKQHSSSSRSDDSSSSSDVDSQDRHGNNRHQQSQLGRDRRQQQQQQIQQQMPVNSEQALQQRHQHQDRLDRRLVPERRDVGRSSKDKDHSRPSGGEVQQWSHAAVVEGSSRRNRRSPSPSHQYQQTQQRGRHDDEHRRHESSGRQRHGLDDTRNRSPVQQHPSSSSRRPRETCRSRSRSPVNGRGQYLSRR